MLSKNQIKKFKEINISAALFFDICDNLEIIEEKGIVELDKIFENYLEKANFSNEISALAYLIDNKNKINEKIKSRNNHDVISIANELYKKKLKQFYKKYRLYIYNIINNR